MLQTLPLALAISSTVLAGAPTDLLRGEAPLLFSGAEGEDADATLLLDGQPIRGDEIWLWVPAITAGQVDLGVTGQFFNIWDSGPEAGPDGNDALLQFGDFLLVLFLEFLDLGLGDLLFRPDALFEILRAGE